jgi:hypothetical protein
MEILELDSTGDGRKNRLADGNTSWKTCIAYAFLVGIFVLEFVRTADQTLKDRAFSVALDALNHSLALFKNRTYVG